MLVKYVDIIIDISHEAIDRTFQYVVPEELVSGIRLGTPVLVPFGMGNRIRTGYVVGISEEPSYDLSKLKKIEGIKEGAIPIESSLIQLAAFIKERYGSTMIQALTTVRPVKEQVRQLRNRQVVLSISNEEAKHLLSYYGKRRAKAKIRLLNELLEEQTIPYSLVTEKLNISSSTLKAMQVEHVIAIEEGTTYRNVLSENTGHCLSKEIPNSEQQRAIDTVMTDYRNHKTGTYLLHGVTGSGKTLVYIELIEQVVAMGRKQLCSYQRLL